MTPEEIQELQKQAEAAISKPRIITGCSKVDANTFVSFDLEDGGTIHIPPDQIMRVWNELAALRAQLVQAEEAIHRAQAAERQRDALSEAYDISCRGLEAAQKQIQTLTAERAECPWCSCGEQPKMDKFREQDNRIVQLTEQVQTLTAERDALERVADDLREIGVDALAALSQLQVTAFSVRKARAALSLLDQVASEPKPETPLSSFSAYCRLHPHQRFWQALRNWSGRGFVFADTADTFGISDDEALAWATGACDTVASEPTKVCPRCNNTGRVMFDQVGSEWTVRPAKGNEHGVDCGPECTMPKPELEVWLCPVHRDLDDRRALRPLDNCVACIRAERDELKARAEATERKFNTPELHEFAAGVVLESAHQRERWGSDHDAGKQPEDWFWLLGYLAGKALSAAKSGDTDKALHHTISSAAALANWHAAILGQTNMRPGIDPVERGIDVPNV